MESYSFQKNSLLFLTAPGIFRFLLSYLNVIVLDKEYKTIIYLSVFYTYCIK